MNIKRLQISKNHTTPKTKYTRSNNRINTLFHKLWTKAVNNYNYNKKEWTELQTLLIQKRIEV
jgi:hypothetical protein